MRITNLVEGSNFHMANIRVQSLAGTGNHLRHLKLFTKTEKAPFLIHKLRNHHVSFNMICQFFMYFHSVDSCGCTATNKDIL